LCNARPRWYRRDVTDHHPADTKLPAALAVLNPTSRLRVSEKIYGGVGVAFKLAQGLLQTLDWPPEKLRRILQSF